MQHNIKYLYHKRTEKKKLERFKDIYENILKNIHGVAKEALGYQEKSKTNKLWTGEIN